eukprot:937504-Pyramimonas_sp.AAC.1
MCFRCGAAQSAACPFTDATEHAKWRSTCKDHGQHMREIFEQGKYMSVFWTIPGFILPYIVCDVMHVCDLGITQYLNGNIVMELFRRIGGLRTRPDETLADIAGFVKMASKSLKYSKPPLNKLTLGMIQAKGEKG